MRHVRWLVLVSAIYGLGASATTVAARPVLPDMVQLHPTNLSVSAAAGPRYLLAFDSRIMNGVKGEDGPLIVRAGRATGTAPMIADQVIRHTSGRETLRRGIGELVYEHAEDHSHWHFDGFDRYSLRKASDRSPVRPDNKQGFCLPDDAFTPDYCGSGKPDALSVVEGLGPGYIDLYEAGLEGQHIDVTGVPPGLYYLVHWVNADSSVCEANYRNNVSATRIRLWPHGYGVAPFFEQLRSYEGFSLPERPPLPSNCPIDRKRPRLRVRIPRTQPFQSTGKVVAYGRCSERCYLGMSGRLRTGGGSYRIRSAGKSVRARRWVRVRIRLTKPAGRSARRARSRGRAVRIRVALKATDKAGNRSRPRRGTVVAG